MLSSDITKKEITGYKQIKSKIKIILNLLIEKIKKRRKG
jgi:hypothetical protein